MTKKPKRPNVPSRVHPGSRRRSAPPPSRTRIGRRDDKDPPRRALRSPEGKRPSAKGLDPDEDQKLYSIHPTSYKQRGAAARKVVRSPKPALEPRHTEEIRASTIRIKGVGARGKRASNVTGPESWAEGSNALTLAHLVGFDNPANSADRYAVAPRRLDAQTRQPGKQRCCFHRRTWESNKYGAAEGFNPTGGGCERAWHSVMTRSSSRKSTSTNCNPLIIRSREMLRVQRSESGLKS